MYTNGAYIMGGQGGHGPPQIIGPRILSDPKSRKNKEKNEKEIHFVGQTCTKMYLSLKTLILDLP